MKQMYDVAVSPSKAATPRGNLVGAVGIFFLLTLFIVLSLYQISPPDAVPASAPATDFSSGRALQHLKEIARLPHPIGSAEHAKVRGYILKELATMGITPEVQKTTAVSSRRGVTVPAGTVENIIAKLEGAEEGEALLLAGHYDSVPTGPGASDDGSAVATLLETLRALKAGQPLKNDVIFLFTDGEEVGLLGAKAFVDEHPAAGRIALALNFEARGNGGPSIMFETSDRNGWLIREFAEAAPHPLANSLSYEIYKRLPNDTDFTVFKEAGLAGLNFAFIKGVSHYHSQLDSVEQIDERSLQHQGSYALALTRHFGNLSLGRNRESNAVYFNVLGSTLFHYAGTWAVALAAFVALLLVAVFALGFKRRRLTVSGILLSFLAFALTMVCASVVVALVWWVVGKLHSGYELMLQGETYNSGTYLIGFVALIVSITSALFVWYRRKLSTEDLMAGSLLWWFILMLFATIAVPGGSFLFTWPLLFSLILWGYILSGEGEETVSWKRFALLAIGALPGILLLAPMIYLVFLAMTLRMVAVVAVLVVLLLGLLVPHLYLMSQPNKWVLPTALALASLGFIVAGSLTSGFDKSQPKPASLFYAMNADSGKAVWASYDQRTDEWTSHFLAENKERGALSEYIPSGYNRFLKSQAPTTPLGAPNILLLEDSTNEGIRKLRMLIQSTRQAPVVSIYLEPSGEVLEAAVNGKRLPNNPENGLALRYYALPQEGIELALQVKASEPVKIRAVDMSYGLPEIPGAPYRARPDYIIPSIQPFSDSTLVSKTFTF
jgi:peptidase M28-like protein